MPRAKKSLGQNFLIDPNIQIKIVAALAASREDEVLEIGPGTGALTHRLAGSVRRLIAVELDDALAETLQREFASRDDVLVLHRDALTVSLDQLSDTPERLKVVGNIPYNITTPLIFRLLDRATRPAAIVLMVQREVAERILAAPGEKEYGALSVGVRIVADAERLFHVRRGAFRPVPNVDSTVIRITPHRPPQLSADEEADVRTLTRVAFGWRRKQFQKILRSAPEYGLNPGQIELIERATGLTLEARPETLDPKQFVALARVLRAHHLPRSGSK